MSPGVKPLGRALGALGVAVLLAAAGAKASLAQTVPGQACDASAYRLSLRSATGPPQAVLSIRITAGVPECVLPETLTRVQVSIRALNGSVQRTLEVGDVASPAGAATVRLGRVARRQLVLATVTFGPEITLSGQTRTMLKPDLALTSVKTNRISLSGRPFFVTANVRELRSDGGTTAVVSVKAGGSVLGATPVAVAAGRRAVVKIPVVVTPPGRTRLTVTITAANPAETTTRNNTRRATVVVTEFRVLDSSVVVPSFAGYGGQFNHHVYAAISRSVGVTDENVVEMERKMRALNPQFSRIFFTPAAFNDPDRMQSFIRTVQFAQSTGTTINITWQGGTFTVASGNVQKFADVLIDLVRNRGITRFRWLTIQNEPNRTRITPEQYEGFYRALDPYIQSIRGQVRYMGGDLVRGPDVGPPDQQLWFDYLAAHMSDILDAYSIHVFWDYWDIAKLQERLIEVRAIVDAMPAAARKPLFVTEYGVRGHRRLNDVRMFEPGVWEDGTWITETNISAFQHAWFDVLAARLGYMGTSKWDAYFGKYDNATQVFYMIGSPERGWPLFPLYHFIRLMTTTVKREWKIVSVDSVPDTSRLLAAYIGKRGQRTVVGLDTAGALLNTVSPTVVPYSIGGLPPSTKLRLAVWNEAGDGLVASAKTVSTDAVGVVNITVPQHAVFALTTLRLS
jgi:hypothetical protein